MKALTIEQIAKACGGEIRNGSFECPAIITGVTTDSRHVKKGDLFIPIKGARVDGHDFIETVLHAGAGCTLTEKELPDLLACHIRVSSTLQAIKDIAEFYRQQLHLSVVGITGSVGKTSTKEAIASVLDQKFETLKTQGNFNNEIGLPLTVFRLEECHEAAVLEMGISNFGEMHRLSKIARPDICVITNIGDCHLESLGDRPGVLRAKSEIFDFMSPDGIVILNGDDNELRKVNDIKGKRPFFFGLDKENDIYAEDIIHLGLKGMQCRIHVKNPAICADTSNLPDSFTVNIPIPGMHMVYNALAAVSVGLALGLNEKQLQDGIFSIEAVAGRNHIIHTSKFTILDDCYNANPISMKASLDVLKQESSRKVAILGDMFELGEQEKQLHREVGQYASECGIDVLICVGDRCHAMARGAIDENIRLSNAEKSGVDKIIYIQNREFLLAQLSELVENGDTILVKASNGMGFVKVVEALESI